MRIKSPFDQDLKRSGSDAYESPVLGQCVLLRPQLEPECTVTRRAQSLGQSLTA
jgi:hypothetical protein